MSGSSFVTLRGGLTLPVTPVRLALDLEARGLHLGVDGEALTVGPKELLTDVDRGAIRQWREHLKAIAAYAAVTDRVVT
ncbi:MAG: hypothetical protein AB7N65_30585 [Vicinamibacterales bacterium]